MTPEMERELAALDDALAGHRVAPDLTELGELALALRDERPAIDAGFAHDMDERVRLGFSDRGSGRVASPRRHWWRSLLSAPALATALAVGLVALIFVAGNDVGTDGGGGASSSSGDTGASADYATAPDAATAGGGATASDSGGQAAAESATTARSDEAGALPPSVLPPDGGSGAPGVDGRATRRVERSASLTLAARSRDINSVSNGIQGVASSMGGFVVSASVNESEGGGDGTFELRVPTRKLDDAMAALAKLRGVSVRERAQRSQDITVQTVSARSRLREARAERESLLRQLADATTLTETQAIRARLRIVANEIEAARADVRRVRNRAAFSNISVSLLSDNSAAPGPTGDKWTPGDALDDALRVLEVAAGVALIAGAVLLPLALLAGLAALGARWGRRRRREHALDAI
jgi:hypothetical protein